MRIKLLHSILLALLVSATSLTLYRAFCERMPDVAVRPVPSPAPGAVVCAEPERVAEPVAHAVDAPAPSVPVASCGRCAQERMGLQRNRGSLAHRVAFEMCQKRYRCTMSDEQAAALFEAAVMGLRLHETTQPCAALLDVSLGAGPDSLWAAKAETLHARRCLNLAP